MGPRMQRPSYPARARFRYLPNAQPSGTGRTPTVVILAIYFFFPLSTGWPGPPRKLTRSWLLRWRQKSCIVKMHPEKTPRSALILCRCVCFLFYSSAFASSWPGLLSDLLKTPAHTFVVRGVHDGGFYCLTLSYLHSVRC